jgi:magnesium chelatase family protein
MIAHIRSLTREGLDCTPVDIEVDVSPGLPQFVIVGLPDTAVSEARDRVRAAITNSGLSFPRTRVTVNLAPAHIKKVGSHFDLPIAIGILLANGTISATPNMYMIGELALDGGVRAVRSALPMVVEAVIEREESIIVPKENEAEIAVMQKQRGVHLAQSLVQIVTAFSDGQPLNTFVPRKREETTPLYDVDMSDIVGQHVVKRALEIAASGAHNLVMVGPPGAGKSMLANALVSILPTMTQSERLEATMVHSVSGNVGESGVMQRPFRAPHHSATAAAILGGGRHVQPGEISLAHHGVLFFDELPEFKRSVLEALRQPLEEGTITINRAQGSVSYPAACQYVAALNPCPCGFFGDTSEVEHKQCSCSAANIERYQKKLSGPLLDRIDLKLSVAAVDRQDMIDPKKETETSAVIRARVEKARLQQLHRQNKPNAQLSSKQTQAMPIESTSQRLLEMSMEKTGLSMRGYIKTLKVARTIADLEDSAQIHTHHVAEALNYTQRLPGL